jgi:hypothetical protein
MFCKRPAEETHCPSPTFHIGMMISVTSLPCPVHVQGNRPIPEQFLSYPAAIIQLVSLLAVNLYGCTDY